MTVYSWSTTAASNASADSTINYAEGQLPGTLNDSARAMMARWAAWLTQVGGTVTYGGSSNAYTATSPSGHALAAYAAGIVYALKANHTNTGAATINIDTLGVKSIVTPSGAALVAGDLVSGGLYLLIYDGTNFQLLNTTTVDFSATQAVYSVGSRGVPQNSQSAAYTLVASDAGKHILHPSSDTTARTFTIPAHSSVPWPDGTTLTFINQHAAGVVTIAITSDTMRLAGAGTTGSRTLAADGIATAIKIASTEWLISGTGLT
jgi:hypothetical protein